MARSKVRVGIVGAGPVAGLGARTNSHAGGYRCCEDAELVAVADINAERLQQFGEEWEIAPEHRYPTAVDMYEKANLDVVSVTTHNLYHHQPVIDAAEAGIEVIMVEKPLAISVALGRSMVEACERAGARLITEHTRRFLPHYRRLKQMIDAGAVGKMKTVTWDGCRPLLHNGTHVVDGALYLAPAEPLLVSGYLNDEPVVDPGGAGMIACSEDIVIFINCIVERKETLGHASIAGSAGRINFCDRRGIWEYGPLVEEPDGGYGAHFDLEPIPDMPDAARLSNSFHAAARESVDCLLENRESVSTGRDGLKALEVITAMHISHKTGAQVPLPLADGLDSTEIPSTGE